MYRWIQYIAIVVLFVSMNTFGQAQSSLQRSYDKVLHEKYTGKKFEYKAEKTKEPKDDKEVEEALKNLDNMDLSWLGKIFVFLLIAFLAFVIIKAFYGSNFKLSKTKKENQKKIEIIEEEEINIEQNFTQKLKAAIDAKDFRLATRYYYLQTLKDLSTRKLIDFHIEKTNLDYQFEIQNVANRHAFKSISKIYDYIWYGKFNIDEDDFQKIEREFNQFATQIK